MGPQSKMVSGIMALAIASAWVVPSAAQRIGDAPPRAPQNVGNSDLTGTDAMKNFWSLRQKLLENPAEQTENYRLSGNFARCAVSKNEARAQVLLDQAVAGRATEKEDIVDYARRYKGCFSSSVGVDRDFFLAGLSEELIKKSSQMAELGQPGTADEVKAFIKSIAIANPDRSDPMVKAQIASECRVGFAPVPTRAVLETEPGSADEAAAIAALRSVTSQCDGIEESQASSYFERAFLAQSLYHWWRSRSDQS
ncbi:MAG: hypothetical protein GW859_02205 [Sphingomonadales bacterium]|nr:hypothetical protein [Sphingomonadales bacterium]